MKNWSFYILSLAIYAGLYYAAVELGHRSAHWLLACLVGFAMFLTCLVAANKRSRLAARREAWLPFWFECIVSTITALAFAMQGWWFSAFARVMTTAALFDIHQTDPDGPEAAVMDAEAAVRAARLERLREQVRGEQKAVDEKVERMRAHLRAKAAGYAGMLPGGELVDRREHPEAIPIPKNDLLGVPEPKPVDGDDF